MKFYDFAVLSETKSDSYEKIFKELLNKFNVSNIDELDIKEREKFFKELVSLTKE